MGLEIDDRFCASILEADTARLQTKLFIENGGGYLLLQRSDNKLWELPGGPFTVDQLANFMTAVREGRDDAMLHARNAAHSNLFRETGLKSGEVRINYQAVLCQRGVSKVTLVLGGTSDRREITLPLHASGTRAHLASCWIPTKSFRELGAQPYFEQSLETQVNRDSVMYYDAFRCALDEL